MTLLPPSSRLPANSPIMSLTPNYCNYVIDFIGSISPFGIEKNALQCQNLPNNNLIMWPLSVVSNCRDVFLELFSSHILSQAAIFWKIFLNLMCKLRYLLRGRGSSYIYHTTICALSTSTCVSWRTNYCTVNINMY